MPANQSSLLLDREGNLSMVLANQVELTENEQNNIAKLSQHLGMLSNVERTFSKEKQKLVMSLLSNPDYQNLIKYGEKMKTVKELQKRTRILLDAEYDKVFETRDMSGTAADLYAQLLPEAPAHQLGKRGRPRKEAV